MQSLLLSYATDIGIGCIAAGRKVSVYFPVLKKKVINYL